MERADATRNLSANTPEKAHNQHTNSSSTSFGIRRAGHPYLSRQQRSTGNDDGCQQQQQQQHQQQLKKPRTSFTKSQANNGMGKNPNVAHVQFWFNLMPKKCR